MAKREGERGILQSGREEKGQGWKKGSKTQKADTASDQKAWKKKRRRETRTGTRRAICRNATKNTAQRTRMRNKSEVTVPEGGNRITLEHHQKHHCRTQPFFTTAEHHETSL